ncbi:hypothetical protein AMTR_s00052p00138640 [Amborella trichopoda]|uniref:Uncharacterized protein n=1 Tax=Amborella trichopoda TaxID=13333 RepID=U5D1U2_AMBTC|nr:hypothetical protein AMTR_s00052p00138640 [Amborella trichopoda]
MKRLHPSPVLPLVTPWLLFRGNQLSLRNSTPVVASSSSFPSSVLGTVVSYDNDAFERFESLLKDLEIWGFKALQRESEVQELYGTYLASLEETLAQHQSLMRSYDERKAPLHSYQAGLKKEDSTNSAETKAVEEERVRSDIYINQLKTKQNQMNVEVPSKSQELKTLNSEAVLTNTMSNQVTQEISILKEKMNTSLELSKVLKTKIHEALEIF